MEIASLLGSHQITVWNFVLPQSHQSFADINRLQIRFAAQNPGIFAIHRSSYTVARSDDSEVRVVGVQNVIKRVCISYGWEIKFCLFVVKLLTKRWNRSWQDSRTFLLRHSHKFILHPSWIHKLIINYDFPVETVGVGWHHTFATRGQRVRISEDFIPNPVEPREIEVLSHI